MFKKYLNIFFPTKNKKRNKNWWHVPSFQNNTTSTVRKYQKRKKTVLQKICNHITLLANIPYWIQYLGFAILIICSWIYVLFYSEFTNIKTINIYREWALIDINRSYSVVDYIRGNNLLTTSNANIAQRLQKSQSAISQIRINKNFPDTINIFINSYNPVFQTERYFILSNGSVTIKEKWLFPDVQKIYLSEDISWYIDFGGNLDPKKLEIISEILPELTKNILWFTPQQVFYFIKERELILRSSNGVMYIFDLERDVNQQIKQLAIYLAESWAEIVPYIYIDIRIPDRVFLCSSETENICLNNIEQIYGDTISKNPLQVTSESPL